MRINIHLKSTATNCKTEYLNWVSLIVKKTNVNSIYTRPISLLKCLNTETHHCLASSSPWSALTQRPTIAWRHLPLEVLRLPEVWQQGVIVPAPVAEVRPVVVVAPVAPHIAHTVYGWRASHYPPPGVHAGLGRVFDRGGYKAEELIA